MGGNNPYMEQPKSKLPTKPYKVMVENSDQVIEVRPDKIPYGETGQKGSLLDVLLGHNVDIDHACGGVCACSTCHVYIKQGLEHCSAATDDEQDMIDMAPDVRANSRLACQCIPNGDGEIVVEIPGWNRNLAREGH
jgi:ferredoxin, 2Fe-2S